MKSLLSTPVEELSLEQLLDIQLLLITKIESVTIELNEREKLFYETAREQYMKGEIGQETFNIFERSRIKNKDLIDYINKYYK
jgi:hypothetical protein